MHARTQQLIEYRRLATREVKIGYLVLGNYHPVRVQTMTTTDTMDTIGTVEQAVRCIKAGAELVRITAPSKKEAENLLNIKNELRSRGYHTPLVADIHFTPNAAEIAARIVEKVRVNPGNYVDKKKFELIEYSDAEYREEIDRIQERFTPLIRICKEYGTAMRIGTNHGYEPLWRHTYGHGGKCYGVFAHCPVGELSQHCAEHEEQQPAGDGAGLPLAGANYATRVW